MLSLANLDNNNINDNNDDNNNNKKMWINPESWLAPYCPHEAFITKQQVAKMLF